MSAEIAISIQYLWVSGTVASAWQGKATPSSRRIETALRTLHEQRSGVQAARDDLLAHHLRLAELAQLHVDFLAPALEHLGWERCAHEFSAV